MNDKAKKPQKLRARLPRGLADRGAAELAALRRMTETIRGVYERYGFDPVETPAFEYTDALGKFLPDQDRPNEGVFSFQDDDEQWVSLRYDLTAPLARYVAENYQHLPMPYRSYRAGYVYRNEKPGPGRFRQFMQFDADTVGSPSPAADAEMCMMAADAMEALGFDRGQYVVKVNSRKILDGVLESIGLGGDENAGRRLTVLRAIDKADKFAISEIRKLLGEGRWDGGEEGKGDFTKGAGLEADQQTEIISATIRKFNLKELSKEKSPDLSDVRVSEDGEWIYDNFLSTATLAHLAKNETGKAGAADLEAIAQICDAAGYRTKRIMIDPSVVRGLEYYTGAVFEVELLLDTKDDKGRPVRFGSVGGGGRYDGLVSRFMGQPVPATGFSIGVSRLQAALELLKQGDAQQVTIGPIVVTVFDKERLADYQKLVKLLRDAPIDPSLPNGPKIRAELYLGNPKNMGSQLKYADKRKSPCVIIQGSDELRHVSGEPHVIVKDLMIGSDVALVHSVPESDLSAQDFKASRNAQAQKIVRVSEMITTVQTLLARHEIEWR